MNADTIMMIIFSGLGIWWAIKGLEWLFKVTMHAMNKVGAFIAAILPAFAVVLLSSFILGITEAQAAAQFVTTDIVLGAIGIAMFGE